MNLYEHKLSQVPSEIDGFIELLKKENVTRFLEIGSRFGGSLWKIANALPKGSKIVSVDSGKGQGGHKVGAKQSLADCAEKLKSIGYDVYLFVGHSQNEAIVKAVRSLGPFDCVFIDGDHRCPGLKEDWRNYGSIARLVAFHDIAWVMPIEGHTAPVDVPILWNEIKGKYRHHEFVDMSGGQTMGIGVLWH